MKIDETPAANGEYFCDFLWARLPAATPEQAAEDAGARGGKRGSGTGLLQSRRDIVTGYREFTPLVTDLFRAPLLRLLSLFACGFAVMLVDQLVVQKVVTTAVGTRWSP